MIFARIVTILTALILGLSATAKSMSLDDTPLYECALVVVNPFMHNSKETIRYPHYECRFAWGPDNCVAGPDTLCIVKKRYSSDDCSGDPLATDITTTSTCPAPTGPGGTG